MFWVSLITLCGWIFTNSSGETGEEGRDHFLKILEGITTETERVSDRDNRPFFLKKSKSQKDNSKGSEMSIEKIHATLMVRLMQYRVWF